MNKLELIDFEEFKEQWIKNLDVAISSSRISIELLLDKIKKNEKQNKKQNNDEFNKLTNRRPIIPIIRFYWESYITNICFKKYGDEYIKLVRFWQILNDYCYSKEKNKKKLIIILAKILKK